MLTPICEHTQTLFYCLSDNPRPGVRRAFCKLLRLKETSALRTPGIALRESRRRFGVRVCARLNAEFWTADPTDKLRCLLLLFANPVPSTKHPAAICSTVKDILPVGCPAG